jgi:asparagine N-glycosylation enzyme membrane subunit Stt3
MRKRAQRKSKPIIDEPKHIIQKTRPTIETKPAGFKKNWWVAITIVGIFFLVLFFNSYFNITSEQTINPEGDTLSEKFYLSGPDPYYNMRIVEETAYGENAGYYQFYSDPDPLLNYPIPKSGGRPPLLNMAAIGFSRLLTPFMNEVDAVGYAMQFVPALFGALLVFPVYFIGKTLFGKREGLIAALFLAIIPVHLSSGHGSAYSLFDHDSFNLLLYFLAFVFLIKAIKEKDSTRSVLFALLSGVSIAALSMTWVEARFIYVVIAVYAVVQIIIDLFTNKIENSVARSVLIALLSGYLISLPVTMAIVSGFSLEIPLFLCIVVAVFGAACYIFNRKRIPWTLSLPTIFCAGSIGLVFLYFIRDISSIIPFFSRLGKLSTIAFGTGIYGSKVSMTIAEANTYNISHTVMSFGPVLYWLGFAGFIVLAYYYYKNNQRRDYLFILVLFLINMWLTSTAGRFINDVVPVIAILGGWITFIVVDKIDYKQMLRNIRSAGGNIHGLRRGVKFLHVFGILFIAVLVIFPNAYLAFDAAVPSTKKSDVFGKDLPSGAYGLPHGKEAYWVDAYSWLNSQDLDIADPAERPAYISWWDYGFYEVAIGGHPTVADNFQDGIPPASNFHTSTSEEEAIAVLVVRLMEGNLEDNDKALSNDVVLALENHLNKNDTVNITTWMENPESSPSYNTPVAEEYDKNLSQQWRVGAQWKENAAYHDITDLLLDRLDDEGITWLYHDIQEATGYSIRYYGVEGYDKQIFDIFGFLADKSLLLVAGTGNYNPEDMFTKVFYTGYEVDPITKEKVRDGEWSFSELNAMSGEDRKNLVITNTRKQRKDPYFNTMFYRTYIGPSLGTSGSKSEPNYQLPCIGMRHFYAEYLSDFSKYQYYTNKGAVVIAKYYEGAYINGSVTFNNNSVSAEVVVQKNLTYYENFSIPIDHDKTTTNNGNFNLIGPAGEFTIQIRRNTELGAYAFVIKNVTFDSATDPELFPVTDDEAMRVTGTNYERTLNITIDPSSVEGYIYLDNDDNETYDPSSDEPISNVEVILTEIERFNPYATQATTLDEVIEQEGSTHTVTTNETGYYNASNLVPGYYAVVALQDDYIIHVNPRVALKEGRSTMYNISKPEPVSLEGTVYYDVNENSQYDAGEEMGSADVDILYKTLDGYKTVNSTVTDDAGSYSFSALIPGQYTINATKLNRSTGYLDYEIQQEVIVTEEVTIANISIGYAPIKVSGYTTYDSENIGNISVLFSPDVSVDNNSAVSAAATSDGDGYYTVDLAVGKYNGYYNVSVNTTIEENGQNVTYVFTGYLEIQMGEGRKSFDIVLAKEEL